MSDPASCVPPDPSVSGWWWLKLHDYEGAFKWSSPDEQGGGNGYWLYAALDGKAWTSDDATRAGYRILGPVPSHADVVEAREQIAQDGREIERLEAELTAANAAIKRLKTQAKAATIYLKGVAEDFPDLTIVKDNTLLLLSGSITVLAGSP